MANHLEATFPGLAQGSYAFTSARSRQYNCIAWAAGDNSKWWWPGPDVEEEFWPSAVPRVETLDAFQAMFTSLGYVVCPGEDLESGFEKIAIFARGKNEPTHAVRQLADGRWTSKLGTWEDIEHALHDLEGDEYGAVEHVMKRPTPP